MEKYLRMEFWKITLELNFLKKKLNLKIRILENYLKIGSFEIWNFKNYLKMNFF